MLKISLVWLIKLELITIILLFSKTFEKPEPSLTEENVKDIVIYEEPQPEIIRWIYSNPFNILHIYYDNMIT